VLQQGRLLFRQTVIYSNGTLYYRISRKHQFVKKVFRALNIVPPFPMGNIMDEEEVGIEFPRK
jgi:hypothetical protein